jgi:UDP-galactopyranose mutase
MGDPVAMKVQWMIVGAGFSGAILAERIASELGERVLLVDRRDHIGGNAFDHFDESGILVHKYGPHIFHTNDARLWRYLSRFTEWRPYYHRVLASVEGNLVPIPFNLNSLRALFPKCYGERLENRLVEEYGFNVKVPILKLRESGSPEVRTLAEYIYRYVYERYTLKQWGVRPEELASSVTARVPVFISHDDRYFQDAFQAMPARGYTEMFRRMLSHKNIKLLLNTDYTEINQEISFDRMVYTGPIDSFFEYLHGKLPYRSLRFEFGFARQAHVQQVGTVNYPNDHEFTRVTEFKHLTGQHHSGTTFVREFPEPFRQGENDPYYPFPSEESQELASKYQREAETLKKKVLFVGRLAEYKYFNMDQAAARALMIFDREIAGR